jgi:hypothetical protein
MDPFTLAALAVPTLAAAGLGLKRLITPACPRCKAKSWDRKLCRPLLFCRKCATRCDTQLRVYN